MRPLEQTLEQFVRGQIDLDTLEDRLEGIVRFRFADTNERSVEFSAVLPTVFFGRSELQAVLKRFLRGDLKRRQVSDWAATLRLLDCFDLEASDEQPDIAWDVVDELMSPDGWGELTTESAIRLIHRLESGP